jgi:hypothetical protein
VLSNVALNNLESHQRLSRKLLQQLDSVTGIPRAVAQPDAGKLIRRVPNVTFWSAVVRHSL